MSLIETLEKPFTEKSLAAASRIFSDPADSSSLRKRADLDLLVYLTLDKLDAVKPIVGVPSRVLLAVLLRKEHTVYEGQTHSDSLSSRRYFSCRAEERRQLPLSVALPRGGRPYMFIMAAFELAWVGFLLKITL